MLAVAIYCKQINVEGWATPHKETMEQKKKETMEQKLIANHVF